MVNVDKGRMSESLRDLLKSTLEKISEACNTRKLLQLRQDCQVQYRRRVEYHKHDRSWKQNLEFCLTVK